MIDNIKEKSCCFTGHRSIPVGQMDTIAARTESTIRDLIIESGITHFHVGGAIGFDTLAAEILLRLKETEFPQIKVILVYPFEGYQMHWTDAQKAVHTRLFPKYDEHICVSANESKDAFLARNRYMVDSSSICIAYCTRYRSGTGYTVRYAERNGLRVFNLHQLE